jgi:transcriptional regulator with XRE-family HTH domain
MGRARQTFERRQLGLTLRRLREEAGLTQQAAADKIGRVRSRIVELEEGKGTLSQDDLGKLLECYQVGAETRRTVLALGKQARKRQRGGPHADLLPDSWQRFADLEASATEINNFELGLIPGLLQSPEYVRAIMTEADGIWWEPSDQVIDERIAFRVKRQAQIVAAGQNRLLRFVIAEEVLRGIPHDPKVMAGQLRHLLDLTDGRPHLTVQVLPHGVPIHPARGGSFLVFGFGGAAPPVGMAKVVFGPEVYFDDPADTAALLRAFDRLRELALPPEESRQLINEIARVI